MFTIVINNLHTRVQFLVASTYIINLPYCKTLLKHVMHLAWDLEAATVQDFVKNIALKSLEILPSNSGLNALHIRTNRKFETSQSTGHMHKHVFGYISKISFY